MTTKNEQEHEANREPEDKSLEARFKRNSIVAAINSEMDGLRTVMGTHGVSDELIQSLSKRNRFLMKLRECYWDGAIARNHLYDPR